MLKGQSKNSNEYKMHSCANGGRKNETPENLNFIGGESTLEYIEDITLQLSSIAKENEHGFLAHLLELATIEAHSARSRARWHGPHEQA